MIDDVARRSCKNNASRLDQVSVDLAVVERQIAALRGLYEALTES